VLRERPEPVRPVAPQHLFECLLILAVRRAELSAIASRCAPAHAPGFEYGDAVAALREMKRGGKARIARAHNADIGRLVMIEPAEFRCVLDCRGIIGKGVGGLFHRSSSRTLLRGSGDLEYRFLVAVRMDFV